MKVTLNNREIEVAPEITNLQQLLKSQSLDGPGKAVAINRKVIPRSSYPTVSLEEGMKITVIKAVCGG